MIKRVVVLAVFVAAATAVVACGGSSTSAPNEVTGSVNGHSIQSPNAVFAHRTYFGVDATIVYVSSVPNLCAELQSGFQVKNANRLDLAAWVADANANGVPATDAGTYILNLYGDPPLNEGSIYFGGTDGTCSPTIPLDQGSGDFGKIVFTELSATHAVGTFTASVGPQVDHINGSFDAVPCDLSNVTQGTCH